VADVVGNMVIWQRWWRWVGTELLLSLALLRIQSLLLLSKDANGILQFR
jgi:hypothetical protein